MDDELRINARGLSVPGPRLMVATALEKKRPGAMRVVVSSDESAQDVREFLVARGAVVEVDQVGTEFHVIAQFSTD